jgi:predicted 3-demethylubiquinone-9 3-methyltransferase (glyoxalase superfamily)
MAAPIVPCLWFDGKAQEAADFYARVFPDAAKAYDSGLTVGLRVAELDLMLLNGGPEYSINPSISFFYDCRSEAELDRLWASLSEGGSVLMDKGEYPFARRYGWVADRFGVNWQLILREGEVRQRAFPSLMFTREQAGRAEEAIRFYAAVFKDAEVGDLSRYGPGMEPDREGSVNYGQFRLGSRWMTAMDSAHAHEFGFSEGLSLVVACADQAEVDYFWERLSEGGSEGRCGWLKDRFGLSWQVVPESLGRLMSDPDRAPRVVEAFMKMSKLVISDLEKA